MGLRALNPAYNGPIEFVERAEPGCWRNHGPKPVRLVSATLCPRCKGSQAMSEWCPVCQMDCGCAEWQ